MVGRSKRPLDTTVLPGARVGRYLVLERAGAGGMGEVLRAYDPKLHRELALKLVRLRRDLADADTRLLREAQALAKVSHPNVVPVFDVDAHGEALFIAMEYVEGPTMTQWLRQRERSWREILQVLIEAGRGLAEANARGIIHRDFKPSNVIVGLDGRPRVFDFGLARSGHSTASGSAANLTSSVDLLSVDLTHTAAVMGTPLYMAPEQHMEQPAEVDPKVDQYGFCVTAWEALYGTPPFPAETLEELFRMKQSGPPKRPAGPVPSRIYEALAHGLDADPARRHPSMHALLSELERARRGRGARVAWLGGVLGFVAVAAAVLAPWNDDNPCAVEHDEWASVWHEGRKAQLAARVSSTELAFADSTWQRLQSRVDAHVASWTATRQEACEAALVRGERSASSFDRQLACLGHTRRRVATMLDALEEDIDEALPRVLDALLEIPSPSRCAGVEAVYEEYPVPDEPDLIAAAEGVRSALAEASTLCDLARYDIALEITDRALERARGTGYDPVVAEALSRRALTLNKQSGDPARAADQLEQAYFTAVRSRHDVLAAEVAGNIAFLLGFREHLDAALTWAEHSEALSDRVHAHPRIRRAAADARALIHVMKGEYETAELHAKRALERTRENGADELDRIRFMLRLAQIWIHQQRYDAAQELYDEIEPLLLDLYGAEHPEYTILLHARGQLAAAAGRADEAIEFYTRAIERQRGTMRWKYRLMLALTLGGVGREADGLAIQSEVLQEIQRDGRYPEILANAHEQHGVLLYRSGRKEAGLQHLRTALGHYEKALGPESRPVAYAAGNLGLVLSDSEEARVLLERSKRIFEIHFPADAALRVPLLGLADLALEDGRTQRAIELLERAYGLAPVNDGASSANAEVAFKLAKLLWNDNSDRPRAVRLACESHEFAPNGMSGEEEISRFIETNRAQIAAVFDDAAERYIDEHSDARAICEAILASSR